MITQHVSIIRARQGLSARWAYLPVVPMLAAGALVALSTGIGGCAASRAGAQVSAPPVAPIETAGNARAVYDDEPMTGSLLSRRDVHQTALPLTIIDAEAERQQGITTAAGLVEGQPANR